VTGGGSWLGIHCAAASEYHWPWFDELVGAWFDQHPEIQDRSFYTALGHISEACADAAFLAHLGGALAWLTA
jgi:Trehalose utilisation